MSDLQAVIFDFDGVLADTVPLHYRSFRELFAAEGVEFTFEDYQSFTSTPYWHSGLDFRTDAGTPVLSATAGTVVKVLRYLIKLLNQNPLVQLALIVRVPAGAINEIQVMSHLDETHASFNQPPR